MQMLTGCAHSMQQSPKLQPFASKTKSMQQAFHHLQMSDIINR